MDFAYKAFDKLFSSLHGRHDAYRVFYDFVEVCIANMSKEPYKVINLDEKINRYNDDESAIFRNMFHEWITIMSKKIIGNTDWHDFFGNYYEIIQLNYSKRNFGQFFTPETVVDLMSKINSTDQTGKNVNDPACGSGRFLLAFHANSPGNFMFAEDIDPICVNMTAANMIVHGARGEVVCHNSLDPGSFNFGYRINMKGLFHVEKLTQETAFVCRMWDNFSEKEKETEIKKREAVRDQHGQMKLF